MKKQNKKQKELLAWIARWSALIYSSAFGLYAKINSNFNCTVCRLSFFLLYLFYTTNVFYPILCFLAVRIYDVYISTAFLSYSGPHTPLFNIWVMCVWRRGEIDRAHGRVTFSFLFAKFQKLTQIIHLIVVIKKKEKISHWTDIIHFGRLVFSNWLN